MSRGGILTGNMSNVTKKRGCGTGMLYSVQFLGDPKKEVVESLVKEDLIPFEQLDVKFQKKVLREGLKESKEAIAKWPKKKNCWNTRRSDKKR